MTFTSVGYPGQIPPLAWARVHSRLGRTYAANGLRVTPTAGGTRQVTALAGNAIGRGVYDETTIAHTTDIAPVVSGTTERYDLIVLRRNWQTKTTTVERIEGTATRALPARNVDPGVIDDQPLALVRWVADRTDPAEIIDLRVWQSNGGAVAVDKLALTYLAEPGAVVRIGDELFTHLVTSDPQGVTSAAWDRVNLRALPLYGVGATLSGDPDGGYGPGYAADRGPDDYLFQAGTAVAISDGAGYARITWPREFPHGLVTYMVWNGDDVATPGMTFGGDASGPWKAGTKKDAVYRCRRGDNVIATGTRHRINWVAIGW